MGDSARLSAAMADAPTGAGVEPQKWDASRIRAFEQTLLDSGRQIYSVAARHDDTGCLAAITQVTIDPASPDWAQQGITAVLPEHRGHRLGLLTKTEMLELLIKRAPDVRASWRVTRAPTSTWSPSTSSSAIRSARSAGTGSLTAAARRRGAPADRAAADRRPGQQIVSFGLRHRVAISYVAAQNDSRSSSRVT
jgi:GNAT superfamily N-acetyltransferase